VSFVEASRLYAGNPVPAVDELSLEISDGEFMVLVGPTGSGKSTALRMLAGLEEIDHGEIHIGGMDVSHRAPKDRDIAMVFQNYALYPHMSVGENMGFALKLKGLSRPDRDAKVLEAARLLDLEEYLDRKPNALSGGQRQRVAMGRAIVREPSVFLMDEPLSNLDARLRVETRANIAALQSRLGTTTLYVTHDQGEAMALGHRVAVLKDGVLQQVGPPDVLYDSPANAFVARFIGSPGMNLRPADLVPGGARLGDVVVALPPEVRAAAAAAGLSRITLGLRPDAFARTDGEGVPVKVKLVEESAGSTLVHGSLPGDDPIGDRPLVLRLDGPLAPRDVVRVLIRDGQAHAFHPDSGQRLGPPRAGPGRASTGRVGPGRVGTSAAGGRL
jgi:multiple sugar transport system ATP-binding protein